jgi:multidrug efflux pump subunit AcrA (membrane-fusion protein)
VCDQLVEAAGGRPHSGITEADVAASRSEWEAQEQARIEQEQAAQEQAEAEQLVNQQLLELESRYTQLYNQYIASALIDQRVVDESQWVAGIQAMADNFVE